MCSPTRVRAPLGHGYRKRSKTACWHGRPPASQLPSSGACWLRVAVWEAGPSPSAKSVSFLTVWLPATHSPSLGLPPLLPVVGRVSMWHFWEDITPPRSPPALTGRGDTSPGLSGSLLALQRVPGPTRYSNIRYHSTRGVWKLGCPWAALRIRVRPQVQIRQVPDRESRRGDLRGVSIHVGDPSGRPGIFGRASSLTTAAAQRG